MFEGRAIVITGSPFFVSAAGKNVKTYCNFLPDSQSRRERIFQFPLVGISQIYVLIQEIIGDPL
jgi:hypothetical protein